MRPCEMGSKLLPDLVWLGSAACSGRLFTLIAVIYFCSLSMLLLVNGRQLTAQAQGLRPVLL